MAFEDGFMNSAPQEAKTKEQKELDKLLQEKQQLMMSQNQQFLDQLFMENATKPVNIKSIQINNSNDFRVSFLNKQFQPLNKQYMTLKDFFASIDEVTTNFTKVGLLENLMIQLHTGEDNSYGRMFGSLKKPMNNPDTLNLIPAFNLFPVKKFFAKTGSNIGNGEGDGYIQFQLKNLFGGGENVSFDATTGTRTSASYLINYNMPIMNNTSYIWENLFHLNTRSLDWIGCENKSVGMTNKIYTKLSGNINHEISINNIWRNLSNTSTKSLMVLNQCGNNFKSALNYSVYYDTRDNIHLPTSGKFLRFGIEACQFDKFNSNKFFKSLIETQFAAKVNDYNHLIFSNKFGFLYSGQQSYILDRFFIGGPNDVRGFTLNGLGPKSFNNSIGGDLFFNGGVSLISKIPYTASDSNFKFHNFINYGKLRLMNHAQPLSYNVNQLFNQLSVSCGFGILYNHPMARFELNFVLPLSTHQRDFTRKGLQYGIGISFL